MKEIAFRIVCAAGVTTLCRRKNRGKIRILMYHGVVPAEMEPFCWTQLPVRRFERQLKYLKRNHSILKLSEVLDKIQKGLPLPENTAVITFDDGYRNNATVAYPLLKRLGIPATVFLATGCITDRALCWPDRLYLGLRDTVQENIDLREFGLKRYSLRTLKGKGAAQEDIVEYLKSMPWDKKEKILKDILGRLKVGPDREGTPFDLLTWEEIQSLNAEGLIEFGAHTVTHNILSQMGEKDAEREIIDSCGMIEKQLGMKCLWFAYPNGRRRDFTPRSKEVLKANGVLCGLTTIPGLNDRTADPLELRRISVGADMSSARFQCLVSGLLYAWKDGFGGRDGHLD